MSAIAIAISVGVIIVGIVFAVWWFSDEQKTKRKIKALPIKSVVDVQEGELVRLVGRVSVEAGQVVQAPLSGRPCLYYRVHVQEQRGSGKSRHWVTIIDDVDGVDFLLSDQTGRARIKTQHVKPLIVFDQKFNSGFMNDAGPHLEAYLSSFGHESQGMVFNKTIQYNEGAIEEGTSVVVVGVARWEEDPDPQAQGQSYRERAKRLVIEPPPPAEPLLLSNQPSVLS